MKKAILLLAILLLPALAQAQTANDGSATITGILSQLKWDAGVAWAVKAKQFEQTDTVQLLNYKGVGLNVGYGTVDSLLIGISYDNLPKLADFGIAMPILNQLTFQPTVFYGMSRINGADIPGHKDDVVIGAKLISIKF